MKELTQDIDNPNQNDKLKFKPTSIPSATLVNYLGSRSSNINSNSISKDSRTQR